MPVFQLQAHVLDRDRTVTCESDGGGLELRFPEGSRSVRSVREAIRIAGEDIGRFLRYAQNRSQPWGLYVAVGGAAAKYGQDPPGMTRFPALGAPADPNSVIARIYREYHVGDGPMRALENAVKIIRAYLDGRRRSAA